MSKLGDYPFPVKSIYSKAQAEELFIKINYSKTQQEMFHYWVILPKTLKAIELEPTKIKDVNLTNIGRYAEVDAKSKYMDVFVAFENCPFEMNASDWLFNKLSLMGEEILSQRLLKSPTGSGTFADVLTIKTYPSGDKMISRYTVQKDYNYIKGGGNYFLLKTSCLAQDYEKLQDKIYSIATNWNLTYRANTALSELLQTVQLTTDIPFQFKIPNSWKIKQIDTSKFVIEHTFKNINYGVINCYFYSINEYSSQNLVYSDSTKRFFEHIKKIQLNVEPLKKETNQFNSLFDESLYSCTGEILSEEEMMKGVFKVYIFKHGNNWCYFELVGKHQNYQDYHFEANKRCLEMILESFSDRTKN